jgi:hypothetical protein
MLTRLYELDTIMGALFGQYLHASSPDASIRYIHAYIQVDPWMYLLTYPSIYPLIYPGVLLCMCLWI